MNFIKKANIYSIILIAAILVASCKSTKFLGEDESLIKEVKFDIPNSSDIKDKSALEQELRYFLRKDVNKKFIWIPREYIYFKANEEGDTSGIDKWVRNRLGEEPSLLKEEDTRLTASSIEQYLKYKKGYPNASVETEIKTEKKISKITYKINPQARHYVNDIEYYSQDKEIHAELGRIKAEAILKKNDPIDAEIFEQEKLRLVNHFQNSGYVDFAANYILINGDSTAAKNRTDIIFEIVPPFNKPNHQRYKIGSIKVFTDYYNKQDTFAMTMQEVDGINFYTEQTNFIVDPKILVQSIAFKENAYISKTDRISTYNKLSILSSYRFVEVVNKLNPNDSALVDIDIHLTPHANRWSSDIGFDAFNSSLTRSTGDVKNLNLLGLGVSGQFEHKNLLGGSEKYTLSAEVGTQLNLTNSAENGIYRALNYNLNNNLSYPVFKDPFKIVGTLNKIYLASDDVYNRFKNDATTNVNLGFAGFNFRNQYNLNSFNSSLGYRFSDKFKRNIAIDILGFTYNDFTLFDGFIGAGNLNTVKSFADNLFTGLVFRSLNYAFNSENKAKRLSYAFLINTEVSGLEIGMLNAIISPNKTWKLGNLEFSKHFRVEFDGRMTKSYSGGTSLVGRINMGIISPFVKGSASPYIRQFDVGGPNSLRAWAPRVLGPGANLFVVKDQPYAKGDFKLETNIEFRFPIWWIIKGAVFTDAGNIWALNGYENIPDARLGKEFYNQIAVASGWGLRWDFSYFNIRFDFGYRIRDPFKTNGKNWYTFKEVRQQGLLGNVQVAVNYPF
jgi:outer membrane protein insertion porin family